MRLNARNHLAKEAFASLGSISWQRQFYLKQQLEITFLLALRGNMHHTTREVSMIEICGRVSGQENRLGDRTI
jgi:hypothetical protein